jgi:hypothetical protein
VHGIEGYSVINLPRISIRRLKERRVNINSECITERQAVIRGGSLAQFNDRAEVSVPSTGYQGPEGTASEDHLG